MDRRIPGVILNAVKDLYLSYHTFPELWSLKISFARPDKCFLLFAFSCRFFWTEAKKKDKIN